MESVQAPFGKKPFVLEKNLDSPKTGKRRLSVQGVSTQFNLLDLKSVVPTIDGKSDVPVTELISELKYLFVLRIPQPSKEPSKDPSKDFKSFFLQLVVPLNPVTKDKNQRSVPSKSEIYVVEIISCVARGFLK